MGKHRFRFSDMIPNAWFYKLKDMSRTRTHYTSHHNKKKNQPKPTTPLQKPHISLPRYSYYFTTEPVKAGKLYNSPVNPKASDTHFPDTSKKNTKRKTIYKPSPRHFSSSVSTGCTCQATLDSSVWTHKSKSNPTQSPDYYISSAESSNEANFFPEFESPLSDSEDDDNFCSPDSFGQLSSWSNSCNCELTSSTTDIIIDLNDNQFFTRKVKKFDGFDTISELELPPILTKPAKFHEKTNQVTKLRTNAHDHQSHSVKIVKEESVRTQKEQRSKLLTRKSPSNSPGIKLRANSPRIASKKLQAHSRKSTSSGKWLKFQNKSFSESFVVVKSSVDPQRDFKDSMVEMILENNLRTSKDLEDLLACYLSLNSNEYHDLIVKAFEQIWFDMTNLRL